MISDEIRNLLAAAPFVPFTIHMPDRPPLRVPHPDFAHVAPDRRTVIVWPEEGGGSITLNAALISQVRSEAQAA